jgi:hypothetical protein
MTARGKARSLRPAARAARRDLIRKVIRRCNRAGAGRRAQGALAEAVGKRLPAIAEVEVAEASAIPGLFSRWEAGSAGVAFRK